MCSVVLLVFWTIAKKPAVCRIAGHGNLHLVCVVRNLLNRYYPFNICCEAPNEILASHPFNVIARKWYPILDFGHKVGRLEAGKYYIQQEKPVCSRHTCLFAVGLCVKSMFTYPNMSHYSAQLFPSNFSSLFSSSSPPSSSSSLSFPSPTSSSSPSSPSPLHSLLPPPPPLSSSSYPSPLLLLLFPLFFLSSHLVESRPLWWHSSGAWSRQCCTGCGTHAAHAGWPAEGTVPGTKTPVQCVSIPSSTGTCTWCSSAAKNLYQMMCKQKKELCFSQQADMCQSDVLCTHRVWIVIRSFGLGCELPIEDFHFLFRCSM